MRWADVRKALETTTSASFVSATGEVTSVSMALLQTPSTDTYKIIRICCEKERVLLFWISHVSTRAGHDGLWKSLCMSAP